MTSRFVQTLCLLLFLSSCKSLQLASKKDVDQSTAGRKKNTQFIDGVSMTPGDKKTADHKAGKSTQPGSNKYAGNSSSSFNIEKADWLQIKYAIMTDMPVEQLNNLPLLQQIDHWWGTRYCMGGDDEHCIDCSAFTQTMERSVYGVQIPRTAHEQYNFSTHIDDTELKEGDIVSVDIGVYKNAFHGDSAYTLALGNPGEEVLRLMKVTKESLYKGIEKATAGNRIGDIGFAIQDYTEKRFKYGVVRELVGHGLGKNLHEDPQIPNFGRRGSGAKLKEGMVIAIEPMINLGVKEVWYDKDGWTVRTKDGKVSAHYEHNIFVKKGKADILSSFEEIETAEKNNQYLNGTYY